MSCDDPATKFARLMECTTPGDADTVLNIIITEEAIASGLPRDRASAVVHEELGLYGARLDHARDITHLAMLLRQPAPECGKESSID